MSLAIVTEKKLLERFTKKNWKNQINIDKWLFSRTKSFGGRVIVELNLSNYATKKDLKNATGLLKKLTSKLKTWSW